MKVDRITHSRTTAVTAAAAIAAMLGACGDVTIPAPNALADRSARLTADCRPVFQSIVVPGAAFTDVNGFNNRGDVVGNWTDADGNGHPYLMTAAGKVVDVVYPGSDFTNPLDINDAGLIGGVWFGPDGVRHGFTFWHGQWQSIDHPNAAPDTRVRGVDDAGELMGNYGQAPDWIVEHGYIKDRRGIQNVDYPGSSTTDVWEGNGRGQYVGDYTGPDGNVYPYLLDHGRFSTIALPRSFFNGASSRGINAAGTMVVLASDENWVDYSFVIRDGRTLEVAYPGAAQGVDLIRVNDRGIVLGSWYDENFNGHGFFMRLECGR